MSTAILYRASQTKPCRAAYLTAEPNLFPRMGHDQMLLVLATDGRRIANRSAELGGYGWDDEQTPRGVERRLRGRRLWDLLEAGLAVTPPLVEADPAVLATELYADLVVRERPDLRQAARSLEAELRGKFKMAVTAAAREEEREVLVARGRYAFKPRADRFSGYVDVSVAPLPTEGDAHFRDVYHYGSDDRGILFRRLGESVGRPVVDGTEAVSWAGEVVREEGAEKRKGYQGCRYPKRSPSDPRPADAAADQDAVLKHVAAQTGITFATEKRKVWVLAVKQAEK